MNTLTRHFRRSTPDAVEYLQELDADELGVGDYEARLSQPFLTRIVRPMGERSFKAITSLTPTHYLDSVHKKLLLAGLASAVRAEEFVTAQAALTGLTGLAAIAIVFLAHPPSSKAILFLVLLPTMGALFPTAWLNRKVAERKLMILRDLPDTLDLLAISVEAGMGFEGALEVVCQNFTSPLADEFSRTLREMELGLPRRDAFQNLKRRTEVPELSNFVLAGRRSRDPDRAGAEDAGRGDAHEASPVGAGEGRQAPGQDHVPARRLHLPRHPRDRVGPGRVVNKQGAPLDPADRLAAFSPLVPGIRWGTVVVGWI
jgi:hypothetical protein